MNKKLIVVATAALAILVFLMGLYLYNGKKGQDSAKAVQGNPQSLVRAHSPVFGNPEAKVTIVEFFDPACEACRAFYPFVKTIVNSSFGRVKLVLRYAAFHKGSDDAVKVLEAAKIQNLYWPVLEAILKSQPIWASHDKPQPELIWDLIKDTGIDIAKAQADARDPGIRKTLEIDSADVEALKVTRTPGFFVNGKPLADFGIDQLKALVDREVAANYGQ